MKVPSAMGSRLWPCSVPIGNFFGLGKVEGRSSGIEPDRLRDGEFVKNPALGRPERRLLGLGRVRSFMREGVVRW